MSDDYLFTIGIKPEKNDTDAIQKKLDAAAEAVRTREKEYPGRTKCETLRAIRRKIAEVNGIEYHSKECEYHGPCMGTCPVCDAEIRYLDEELAKKRAQGKKIIITGIGVEEIRGFAKNPEPESDLDLQAVGADSICVDMDIDILKDDDSSGKVEIEGEDIGDSPDPSKKKTNWYGACEGLDISDVGDEDGLPFL